jgi:dynein heavy chain 1
VVEGKKREQKTFLRALGALDTADLQQCSDKINNKISEAQKYVETWLQYQALWDMDIDTVCESLGDDLPQWEKLLLDLKRSRAIFDNSASTMRFGPVIVEYGSVQTKVNNKYDQWQKNILSRFSEMFSGKIGTLYSELGAGRKSLPLRVHHHQGDRRQRHSVADDQPQGQAVPSAAGGG